MPTSKATYGTPGVLSLRPAEGLPGTEEYQESVWIIRDRPDRKEDVELHQDEDFSIDLGGRWHNVYADYSGETPVIRRRQRTTDRPVTITGQVRARLRLT